MRVGAGGEGEAVAKCLPYVCVAGLMASVVVMMPPRTASLALPETDTVCRKGAMVESMPVVVYKCIKSLERMSSLACPQYLLSISC